jgi:drug/metabolite transporter (DMT)-like permease
MAELPHNSHPLNFDFLRNNPENRAKKVAKTPRSQSPVNDDLQATLSTQKRSSSDQTIRPATDKGILSARSAKLPSRGAILLAFVALYLCWGGTFLGIRLAVRDIPPTLLVALRSLGGAAILAAAIAFTVGWRRATARQWGRAALSGILLFVGSHALLAMAEQRVPSGQAALHMTAIPMWTLVLASLQTRRRPRWREVLGLGIGVLGIALLANASGENILLSDRLVIVVAALGWAAGSLVGGSTLGSLPMTQATAMQLALGGGAVLVVSLLNGEVVRWHPANVSNAAVVALAFLILGGTVVGLCAHNWLLRAVSPTAVGSYAFVTPLVALGLGAMAGDGNLSRMTAVSAGLVLLSLLLLRAHASRDSAPLPRRESMRLATCETQ